MRSALSTHSVVAGGPATRRPATGQAIEALAIGTLCQTKVQTHDMTVALEGDGPKPSSEHGYRHIASGTHRNFDTKEPFMRALPVPPCGSSMAATAGPCAGAAGEGI